MSDLRIALELHWQIGYGLPVANYRYLLVLPVYLYAYQANHELFVMYVGTLLIENHYSSTE